MSASTFTRCKYNGWYGQFSDLNFVSRFECSAQSGEHNAYRHTRCQSHGLYGRSDEPFVSVVFCQPTDWQPSVKSFHQRKLQFERNTEYSDRFCFSILKSVCQWCCLYCSVRSEVIDQNGISSGQEIKNALFIE